jgi:hypothetical protein
MEPTEQLRLPSRQHNLLRKTATKFECEIFAAKSGHNVSKNAGTASLISAYAEVVSHSLLP